MKIFIRILFDTDYFTSHYYAHNATNNSRRVRRCSDQRTAGEFGNTSGDKYGTWNSSLAAWRADPGHYPTRYILALDQFLKGFSYASHGHYSE